MPNAQAQAGGLSQTHVSTEGALTLLRGYLGIDNASNDLDEPLKSVRR